MLRGPGAGGRAGCPHGIGSARSGLWATQRSEGVGREDPVLGLACPQGWPVSSRRLPCSAEPHAALGHWCRAPVKGRVSGCGHRNRRQRGSWGLVTPSATEGGLKGRPLCSRPRRDPSRPRAAQKPGRLLTCCNLRGLGAYGQFFGSKEILIHEIVFID